MKHYKITSIVLFVLLMCPVVQLAGQTRFARPDTTPNYSGYRYLDECQSAIYRLQKRALAADSIWEDTMSVDTLKMRRVLPPDVIRYAQVCLADVNVDTIRFEYVHDFAKALLVANRDDDVFRLYSRFADSIANDSTHASFLQMLMVYANAVPVRMTKMLDLYKLGLLRLPPDSVTTSLMLRGTVGMVSHQFGDLALMNKIGQELLAIVDTLSPVYRNSPKYQVLAKEILLPLIVATTTQTSIDSLAKSSEAYRNYLLGLWKSAMGTDAKGHFDPIGQSVPEPIGHFWYSNVGTDGKIQKISPKPVIEKGKVTLIYFIQGGCHENYEIGRGRFNGVASQCWQEIHKTRKILEQYPNINLVVVSRTFGSLGDIPFSDPQEEADSLAQYFLGFHKLQGTYIVYQSEFFRLPKYDNRKIDEETELEKMYRFNGKNSLASYNSIVFVDEEGKVFHVGRNAGGFEHLADLRLKTVMARAANQVKR